MADWEEAQSDDGTQKEWFIKNEEEDLIVHVHQVYILRVTSFKDNKDITFSEQFLSLGVAQQKAEELLEVAVEDFREFPE